LPDWVTTAKGWLDEHSDLLDLVEAVLAFAAFLALIWAVTHVIRRPGYWAKLEGHFSNPANYGDLYKRYNRSPGEGYFTAIRWVLGAAHRLYGRRALSLRAFGTCLTIALVYPLLAAILGWVFANNHTPGGLELFRDIDHWFERVWRAILLGFGLAVSVYVINNAEKFSQVFVDKLLGTHDTSSRRVGFLTKATWGVAFTFTFAGAYTFAFAVTFAGVDVFALTGFLPFVFAVTFAVGFAGAGFRASFTASTFASAGAFTLAAAVVVAGANAVTLDSAVAGLNSAAILALFYVFLPLLNAIADLLSVGATRLFLRHVARNRPAAGWILAGLALDLFVAALCLSGLLFGITTVLDIWAALGPSTLPLDWRAYWTTLKTDPWQGIALYLMVFTTLLPTFIHMIAGLGAIWTHKSRKLHHVAERLRSAQEQNKALNDIEAENLTATVRRATYWGYGSAGLLIIAPMVLGIWWVV